MIVTCSEEFECPYCNKKGGIVFRVRKIESFAFAFFDGNCQLGESLNEEDVDGEFYCRLCHHDVMFHSRDYPKGYG